MGRSITKAFELVFLITLLLICGCMDRSDNDAGTLEGTISIGPLCPVVTDPPLPGCLPTAETFAAYPVYVYSSEGTRRISQLSPTTDGTFRTQLEPGRYLLVLGTSNGIGSSNLPQAVTIHSSDITAISIVIDTGIR